MRDVAVVVPGQFAATVPLSAVDLGFPSKADGRPIALVLGREYFANLVFLIQARSRTFQVGPSGSLRLPVGTPFVSLANGRPQVEADVGGEKLMLTDDLGYNRELALGPAAWSKLKLGQAP